MHNILAATSSDSIFFGGSMVAAVIAGAVALFAPCCVSVMLPAFLTSSTHNRRSLIAMTFVFAAGVAAIILPIAMGAVALRRTLVGEHTAIYTIGGLAMLGLATFTLLGGRLHLPMPGRRATGRTGPVAVFLLGAFSGIASSCCAPVLAGVIALSSVASSFLFALGLGIAYVFGMVAPLFVASLLWERYDLRQHRLFRPRSFTWRIGPLRRTVSGTGLVSGLLLAVMGGVVLWLGIRGRAMPSSDGWSARLSAKLAHYGRIVTDALSWIPDWVAITALAVLLFLLARRAMREIGAGRRPPTPPADPMQEDFVEQAT